MLHFVEKWYQPWLVAKFMSTSLHSDIVSVTLSMGVTDKEHYISCGGDLSFGDTAAYCYFASIWECQ